MTDPPASRPVPPEVVDRLEWMEWPDGIGFDIGTWNVGRSCAEAFAVAVIDALREIQWVPDWFEEDMSPYPNGDAYTLKDSS